MKTYLYPILFILIITSCKDETKQKNEIIADNYTETESSTTTQNTEETYPDEYIADSFDFPVGIPDANGYYNAQKFQENEHLGDDWNAVTGGNSDLGDPIYAVANGYVKYAEDYEGAWGNIIRINHKLPNGEMVESFYAHCESMYVNEKQWVKKGELIGTIGNVDGFYLAHLHLEMRDDINLPIGGGYSEDTQGYLDPTEFINNHR